MVFVDWWFVGEVVFALLLIAVGVFGFKSAKKSRNRFARLGARLVTVFFACAGTLLAVWLLIVTTLTRVVWPKQYSSPIYSPGGDQAARIESYNAGAVGSYTSVVLYSAHGLQSKTVYFGHHDSVEPRGVQWISDSKLTVTYTFAIGGGGYRCSDSSNVRVTCLIRRGNQ